MYFPIIDVLKENFIAKIPSIVTQWLTDNVDPVGSAVVVDTSLSISGAAADAKITGDELNDLKSDLTINRDYIISKIDDIIYKSPNLLDPSEAKPGYIGLDGASHSSDSYKYYGYIPVEVGKTYYMNYAARFLTAYDTSFNAIQSSGAENVENYTVPSGVAFIRLSFTASLGNIWVAESQLTAYKPYGVCIKPENLANIGNTPGIKKIPTVIPWATYTVDTFPKTIKKNVGMSFIGYFNSFSGMLIGKGKNTYGGKYFEIRPTTIKCIEYWNSASESEETEHGLTIEDFLSVNWYVTSYTVTVNLTTKSGSFRKTYNWNGDQNGAPFINPFSAMSNVVITCSSSDMLKPVWAFGDSYFGFQYPNRIMYHLRDMGFVDYQVFGYGGETPTLAFSDLSLALEFGNPKFIVWCMGMNGEDSDNITILNQLIEVCEKRGIELILYKVPAVPNLLHTDYNAAVIASGKRYVDAYKAVGCDGTGNWYTGFLDSDKVHPTELGAKAIAMRMLVDAPELMLYK